MSETPDPKGIVMCFIAPDGHVVASTTDFDLDGYGGTSLREAQEYRCRQHLYAAVVYAFCSPVIYEAMSKHDHRSLAGKLVSSGYRIHTITVGHEEMPE